MANDTSKASESEQYVHPSNNSIYSSFGSWPGSMHSYGLKTGDPDDVEEGKRIVKAFKANNKEEWEEKQAEKAKKK
jgi:hypothetical protein